MTITPDPSHDHRLALHVAAYGLVYLPFNMAYDRQELGCAVTPVRLLRRWADRAGFIQREGFIETYAPASDGYISTERVRQYDLYAINVAQVAVATVAPLAPL